MSFQQGLSGLNAAAKNLDAIGNNVANASTVGFKTSQAQFADVYAASLSGSGAGQVGLGTRVAAVVQQFTQGNLTASNNPQDVAINGGGFFRLDNNGAISYTRNGQFQLDTSGNIVTSSGSKVTGYGVDISTGLIVATNPGPVTISQADLIPQATGGSAGAIGAKVGLSLDSRKTVPATAVFSPTDPTSYNNSTSMTVYDSLGNPHTLSLFFAKDPAVGTWNIGTNVDGVGLQVPATAAVVQANTAALGTGGAGVNSLNTRALAVQAAWAVGSPPYIAATNVIASAAAATAAAAAIGAPSTPAQINAAVAAAATAAADMALMNSAVIASPPVGAAQIAEAALTLTANTAAQTAVANTTVASATLSATQLSFNTAGQLTTAMPLTISINLDGVMTALGQPNSAAAPLSFKLDFTGTGQYGSAFGVNKLTQDGYTSGRLSGFAVAADGVVQGRYSNGQSRNMGQLVLANFTNPNGLKPLGNNQWSESTESGQPLVNTPGSGSLGVLQSGSVEESNTDLTAELVNMITAQRVYQANAQTIKTQDAVLQTIVNLR